jgi:hypothetical protein
MGAINPVRYKLAAEISIQRASQSRNVVPNNVETQNDRAKSSQS